MTFERPADRPLRCRRDRHCRVRRLGAGRLPGRKAPERPLAGHQGLGGAARPVDPADRGRPISDASWRWCRSWRWLPSRLFATGSYRIVADATVEGQVQRAVVAPLQRLHQGGAGARRRSSCRGPAAGRLRRSRPRPRAAALELRATAQALRVREGAGRAQSRRRQDRQTEAEQAQAQMKLIDEQLARARLESAVRRAGRLGRPLAVDRRRGAARPNCCSRWRRSTATAWCSTSTKARSATCASARPASWCWLRCPTRPSASRCRWSRSGRQGQGGPQPVPRRSPARRRAAGDPAGYARRRQDRRRPAAAGLDLDAVLHVLAEDLALALDGLSDGALAPRSCLVPRRRPAAAAALLCPAAPPAFPRRRLVRPAGPPERPLPSPVAGRPPGRLPDGRPPHHAPDLGRGRHPPGRRPADPDRGDRPAHPAARAPTC